MVRGERVDGFVVTELLGSGRSGLLYRLEHAISGQTAVLRTLVPGDGGDESSTRFAEEGRRFLPEVGAPRLVRAKLGDGTPVELLLSRRPHRAGTLRRGAAALAVCLLALWVVAAVAQGPGGPAEAAPAVARWADDELGEPRLGASTPDDEGRCPPEAIWRQDVYFALEELDRLAEANPQVRSIRRARSKALLRLVSSSDPSPCARVRAVLEALRRELDQRQVTSGPGDGIDGKR